MGNFGQQSTTNDVIDGISLTGKTAVITGATAGLGIETSRALAGAGAKVVMVGRDEKKLQAAADQLRSMDFKGGVDTELMDLTDLDSVRSAAESLLARYPQLDILVNNAGVMVCPLGRTKQGFETQFGTNHLGHFLFTCLLAPALIAAAPARVVNLSSAGHRIAEINFDDPNFENSEYEKWRAYGASKTANALFAVGLDNRLKSKGVRSYAVHPGIIQTDLARHMSEDDKVLFSRPDVFYKSVPQGAATSVWAATSPDLADRGAIYLEDCHIAELTDNPEQRGGVRSYALDTDKADRLWEISENLVGTTFSW